MKIRAFSYIRFSTPEQLKGDSLRRQMKASESYALEHGLELDEVLTLRDLGLSAYKGAHRTRGALGEFLSLVEKRKVPKGSVLLVESLDRLSREQVLDALNQFTGIIRAGIKVVTLADRMEYTSSSINANFGQLLMSIVIMSRAHEESATKAKRLAAAWVDKRAKVAERKLTARAPEWLRLNEDRTAFIEIPERVAVIRRIFKMKAQGHGAEWIEKQLNRTEKKWIPGRKGNEGGWRKSYINKILRTRAVIGEYQPCQKVEVWSESKKAKLWQRQPVGDPIPDYFPAVIPEDVFYRQQAVFKKNIYRGGQNGPVSNLFTHLVRCGYCGGPMSYENKGSGPKGTKSFVCDNAKRATGCKRYAIPYSEFEELILTYCKNLDAAAVLDEDSKTDMSVLEGNLAAAQSKAADCSARADRLADTIAETDEREARHLLQAKLSSTLAEKVAFEQEADGIREAIKTFRRSSTDIAAQLSLMGEVIDKLKHGGPELRLRLKAHLRQIIESITVYPVGTPLLTDERIENSAKAITEVIPQIEPSELEAFRQELQSRVGNAKLRLFRIRFKGGSMRWIQPFAAQQLVMDIDAEKGMAMYIRDEGSKAITF